MTSNPEAKRKAHQTVPRLDPNRTLTPEEEELIMRLLASAMGLPRVCVFKTCRRKKRCHGPGVVCAEHHRGLVESRIDAAIALIAVPER